ncbi:hypothetical protein YC2023_107327 [Brassica napus]
MTLGRSFSEENNDVKVSELSLELGALTQKIFLQQVLRKVDDHQSSEIMDTLLAAYRDGNADYTITRNHIKALLAEEKLTRKRLVEELSWLWLSS